MNSVGSINPGVGGFLNGMKPIWHPPIHISWIISIILLVVSANAEEIPEKYQKMVLHPIAFFAIIVGSLVFFEYGYIHLTFATLFFLIIVWAIRHKKEGFSPSGTLDWVTNKKLWFSEDVLKEKPIAIQDKNVATYPIQGT
jgi:hypothetical protein